MMEKRLLGLIDSWSQEVVDFTCELVATPSTNPPGDERQIAALLVDRLNRLGLKGAVTLGEVVARPNVLVKLPGTGGGPTLLYVAHTDTKPVGDRRDQWETDPFTPTIKDGRLYGLGAADMKGAVAAFVYAAAALQQVGPPKGDLLLALVADEEAGGRFGAQHLVRHCGIKADMALIGEPPGVTDEWEYLHIGSRGACCFNIKVYGTQMHSSLSDHLPSVNASLKLAELMTQMSRELKFNYTPHPLCPQGVTLNLGVTLKGGVFYGVFPGYAEFGADLRVVPGMRKESVVRDLAVFLAARRKADPTLRVELEVAPPPLDWLAPTELSEDLPIVQALLRATEKVIGFRPPLSIYPAGTDAPAFQLGAGIPTIPAYGPGMISLAHGANEWVGVESIVQACKIYALAAHEVLAGPREPGAA